MHSVKILGEISMLNLLCSYLELSAVHGVYLGVSRNSDYLLVNKNLKGSYFALAMHMSSVPRVSMHFLQLSQFKNGVWRSFSFNENWDPSCNSEVVLKYWHALMIMKSDSRGKKLQLKQRIRSKKVGHLKNGKRW